MDTNLEPELNDTTFIELEEYRIIYSSCDVDNCDSVRVSVLIDFIEPYMKNFMSNLNELKNALDPEDVNPFIASDFFFKKINEWAKNMKDTDIEVHNNFKEFSNNVNYSHCSTPRSNLRHQFDSSPGLNASYSLSKTHNSSGQLDDLKGQIFDLEQQLLKTNHELVKVREQLLIAEEQNNEIQADLERANHRLILEQQTNEHLQKNTSVIWEVKEEAVTAKKEIENLQTLLSTMKKENCDLVNFIKELKTEKIQLETKIESLQKQQQEADNKALELLNVVELNDEKIDELERVNVTLTDKILEQSKVIEHFQNTTQYLEDNKRQLEKFVKRRLSKEALLTTANMSNAEGNVTPPSDQIGIENLLQLTPFKNFYHPIRFSRETFNSPKLLLQLSHPISPNNLGSPITIVSPVRVSTNDDLPLAGVKEDSAYEQSILDRSNPRDIKTPLKPILFLKIEDNNDDTNKEDWNFSERDITGDDDAFVHITLDKTNSSDTYENLQSEMLQATTYHSCSNQKLHEEYEAQIANLSTIVKNHEDCLTQLETYKKEIEILSNIKEQFLNMQKDFEHIENEKDILAKNVHLLTQCKATFEEQIEKIRLERDDALVCKEKCFNDNTVLKNQLTGEENQLSKYAEIEKKILSYTLQLDMKNKDLQEIQKKLDHSTNVQRILKEKIEANVNQKSERIKSLDGTNIKLEEYVGQLKSEQEWIKEEIEKQKQTKTFLESRIKDLECANAELKELCDIQLRNNEDLEKKLILESVKSAEFGVNMDKINEENKKLKTQSEKDKADIVKLKNINHILESQLQRYKNEIDNLDEENHDLETRLRETNGVANIHEDMRIVIGELSELSMKVSENPEVTHDLYEKLEKVKSFVDLLFNQTRGDLTKMQSMKIEYRTIQNKVKMLEDERTALIERTEYSRKEVHSQRTTESEHRKGSYEKQETKIRKLEDQVERLKKQLQDQKVKTELLLNSTVPEDSLTRLEREKDRIEREKEEVMSNLEQVQNELIMAHERNQHISDQCKQEIAKTNADFQVEISHLNDQISLGERKMFEYCDRAKTDYERRERKSHEAKELKIVEVEREKATLLKRLEKEEMKLVEFISDYKRHANDFEKALREKETSLADGKLRLENADIKLAHAENEIGSLNEVVVNLKKILFEFGDDLFRATILAYNKWEKSLKSSMSDESVRKLLDEIDKLSPIKDKQTNEILKEEISNIQNQLIASTHLLQVLATRNPSGDYRGNDAVLSSSTSDGNRNVKKFTLRPSRLPGSVPSSPDSPSMNISEHSRIVPEYLGELSVIESIVDSSNDKSVTLDTSDELNMDKTKKFTTSIEGLIQNIINGDDLPCQEAFPSQSDSFLESLDLHSDGPRQTLDRDEMEKKFTLLALHWKVDSETTKRRCEKQRDRCSKMRDLYLQQLLKIVKNIKKHRCQAEQETLIRSLSQIIKLKDFVQDLFKSAEQYGALKQETRAVKCWNLVTNYVAKLRQELDVTSSSQCTRAEMLSLPKPCDTGDVNEEDASINDIPDLENTGNVPLIKNISRIESSLSLWKRRCCQYYIPTLFVIIFVMLFGLFYITWECVQSTKSTKACLFDFLVKYIGTRIRDGLHPY